MWISKANLSTTSNYEEVINGDKRIVAMNGIPNHLVGQFPTQGNPNTIAVAEENFELPLIPTIASSTTSVQGAQLVSVFWCNIGALHS